MNIDHWITAVLALRKAQKVVVFTGAGISAESGVPTFRDADGFWRRFPVDQFATWGGLLQTMVVQPRAAAEFALHVIEPIAAAEPNAGHRAVAELEKRVATAVVTQNIDGLHQAAGSAEVHEIHGSLLEVVDSSTSQRVHSFTRAQLAEIAATLRRFVQSESSLLSFGLELLQQYPLDWRGRHRPNLVMFGDRLNEPAWTLAQDAADECDVLLSVGTSGQVYPAALLPERAAAAGATVICIDPQPAPGCWLEGSAATVLPKLLHDAFENRQS